MRSPPRLRLEPRPSRIARGGIFVGCASTLALVVMLPLPIAAMAAGILAVLAMGARALRRCGGRGFPALLHVGIDRRIVVTGRDGRSLMGTIADDSYVGAILTTIVWRADGEPWWRPSHAILILPDMLSSDEFRRLRVFLRYGRVAAGEAASRVDAGWPASHA